MDATTFGTSCLLLPYLNVPQGHGHVLASAGSSLDDAQRHFSAHDGAQAEGLEPDVLLGLEVEGLGSFGRLVKKYRRKTKSPNEYRRTRREDPFLLRVRVVDRQILPSLDPSIYRSNEGNDL